MNQVNIFDIYLKLRKKLFVRRKKFYILKITFKKNNTYLTFLNNFGRTLFVHSAGRILASQTGKKNLTVERKGFGIPKAQKPKRHKKLLKDEKKDEPEKNKKPKNNLRNKKRRKARNIFKLILQVFIKKLIN